jgi:acyl-coenzyme A thioesterase 13
MSAKTSAASTSIDRDGNAAMQTGDISFIEKAKLKGAQALLGVLQHRGGFDSVLGDLKVERIDSDECKVMCTMPVDAKLANAYNTLHGGCIATIVDVVGTLALLSNDPKRAGVSTDLSVSFVRAAKVGDTICATGRVLKSGARLGFSEVHIRRQSDNELIATGRHTKAL